MRTRIVVAAVMLLCGTLASAQFRTSFENPPYLTAPGGLALTGQDTWYNPVPAESLDFQVFAYGVPAGYMQVPNPRPGGTQYAAGQASTAQGKFARVQRDVAWPTGKFTVWYDVATTYAFDGSLHSNIASFGARDTLANANSAYVMVYADYGYLWGTEDPNQVQCRYLGYDSGGAAVAQPGISPGPAWEPLQFNNWYRTRTSMDMATNKFTTVSIIDLHTGASSTVDLTQDPNYATQWFMDGGAAGHTQWLNFRLFAGGGIVPNVVGNNVSAWDNICIGPGVGTGDMNCDGVINFGDINPFVMILSDPNGYLAAYPACCVQNGDINMDGVVNFDDINPFVALLSH